MKGIVLFLSALSICSTSFSKELTFGPNATYSLNEKMNLTVKTDDGIQTFKGRMASYGGASVFKFLVSGGDQISLPGRWVQLPSQSDLRLGLLYGEDKVLELPYALNFKGSANELMGGQGLSQIKLPGVFKIDKVNTAGDFKLRYFLYDKDSRITNQSIDIDATLSENITPAIEPERAHFKLKTGGEVEILGLTRIHPSATDYAAEFIPGKAVVFSAENPKYVHYNTGVILIQNSANDLKTDVDGNLVFTLTLADGSERAIVVKGARQ